MHRMILAWLLLLCQLGKSAGHQSTLSIWSSFVWPAHSSVLSMNWDFSLAIATHERAAADQTGGPPRSLPELQSRRRRRMQDWGAKWILKIYYRVFGHSKNWGANYTQQATVYKGNHFLNLDEFLEKFKGFEWNFFLLKHWRFSKLYTFWGTHIVLYCPKNCCPLWAVTEWSHKLRALQGQGPPYSVLSI